MLVSLTSSYSSPGTNGRTGTARICTKKRAIRKTDICRSATIIAWLGQLRVSHFGGHEQGWPLPMQKRNNLQDSSGSQNTIPLVSPKQQTFTCQFCCGGTGEPCCRSGKKRQSKVSTAKGKAVQPVVTALVVQLRHLDQRFNNIRQHAIRENSSYRTFLTVSPLPFATWTPRQIWRGGQGLAAGYYSLPKISARSSPTQPAQLGRECWLYRYLPHSTDVNTRSLYPCFSS